MNFGLKSLLLSAGIYFSVVVFAFGQSDSDDIQWNRWTSDSFVVHSITDDKGKYLKDNLESIKKWILERWGLHQISVGTETIQTNEGPKEYSHIKLWCVDDPKFFKDHYGIADSKVEILRKSDGSIKNIEVFLLLDESPASDIPMPLTEAILAEFEDHHHVKFGWWAHRGMGLLNGTMSQIRSRFVDLNRRTNSNQKVFLSKSLLNMTKDEWELQTDDNKLLFDEEAAIFCLLLRKEFGQLRMLSFLKESKEDPESSLKKIYEFKNYDEMDASFYRYLRQLSDDVVNGKTPNDYLNIKRALK